MQPPRTLGPAPPRHRDLAAAAAAGEGAPRLGADAWVAASPASLALARLPQAVAAVPPQADAWSCGVNCAARALWISGRPVGDYQAFLRACPQSFGPQTPASAHLLARLWGVGWLVRHLMPPVGPHPHLLAAHLNARCGPGSPARVHSAATFAACSATVGQQLARGAAVILLWYRSPLCAHYALVVGCDPELGVWTVLNDGARHRVREATMAAEMDCARCPWRRWVGLGRYNLIALAPRPAAPAARTASVERAAAPMLGGRGGAAG